MALLIVLVAVKHHKPFTKPGNPTGESPDSVSS